MTGGLGTLGLECARALLEHGLTKLAILDAIDPNDRMDQLCQDFPNAMIMYNKVDITKEASVNLVIQTVTGYIGKIDILLSFAGIVHCDHALNTTAEKWRQVQDVNATGTFLVARAVAQSMIAMKPRGQSHCNGAIVLVASISAHHVNYPQPQVAYNVSKAAIVHMTHCLAAEWACHGIRVNCVSPGYMNTILNEGDALEDSRRAWVSRTPMGRMGRIDELAGVIVMLCSPAGSYITGSEIRVDGMSPDDPIYLPLHARFINLIDIWTSE